MASMNRGQGGGSGSGMRAQIRVDGVYRDALHTSFTFICGPGLRSGARFCLVLETDSVTTCSRVRGPPGIPPASVFRDSC